MSMGTGRRYGDDLVAQLMALLMALLTQKEQAGPTVTLLWGHHLQPVQHTELPGLSPFLSSPLSSLVPPQIIRDTLLAPPCFSPGIIPVIADLHGTQPRQTRSRGITFQLEILVVFAVWHPPLLLGQAPVAPVPSGCRRLGIDQEESRVEELESRWEAGSSSLLLTGVLAALLGAAQHSLCLIVFPEKRLV